IVGAGPSGLVTSILLANMGIKNIVINKYPSPSPGPRSHITNQRAMEIFRDLGLEEQAKALSTPQDHMGEHVWGSSLAGEEFGRLRTWSTHPTAKAAHDLASPCAVCDLPQLYLEPMLLNAAMLRGSDVRFQTEYLSHVQDEQGVTARLHDHINGLEYEVHAQYLIGADGARSKVAEDIGLPFEGQMAKGNSGSINVEFTADLSNLVAHRKGDMYWMLQAGSGLNGTGVGVLRMVRPWNRWVCVWGYELAKGAPDLSEEQARSIVQKILGVDNIPIEINAISTWTINQQYAACNTKGRVFCMGDAVHSHTPMAGLGMNTSVQDGYNLAWKLGMVIKQQAGARLLQSYDQERSPIAQQIVNHAYQCLAKLPPLFGALGLPPSPTEEDMQQSLKNLQSPTAEGAAQRLALRHAIEETTVGFGGAHGVELNQRYTSTAVITDGTPDPGFTKDPMRYYQASTRPGAHLPHVWLTKEQRRVSSLDLCGKGGFTLLTGLSGIAWKDIAKQVSENLGVAIKVQLIGPGQEYVDTYGDFVNLLLESGLKEDAALLVRPDMYIGWRATDSSQASGLLAAMKALLDKA
ncbi:MAG: FAD-dependent monooxygenase, partial [Comamonas sp.]|nr:FAD-dependent monooxygenase [Comamonas sp.]